MSHNLEADRLAESFVCPTIVQPRRPRAMNPSLRFEARESMNRPSLIVLSLIAVALLAADDPAPTERSAPSFVSDVVPVLTPPGVQLGGLPRQARGSGGVQAELARVRPGAGPPRDHPRRQGAADRQEPASREPAAGQAADEGAAPGGDEAQSRLARVSDLARLDRRRDAGPDRARSRVITRLVIEPPASTYEPGRSVALKVLAHDSSGGVRDVTRLALFKSNEEGLAEVDESRHGQGPPAGGDLGHGQLHGRGGRPRRHHALCPGSRTRGLCRPVELHRRPRRWPGSASCGWSPRRRRTTRPTCAGSRST